MKLIGMMPVRSEAWCLGLSARVALMWCDAIVILNHESQDASHLIIRGLQEEFGYAEEGGRVHYLAASGGWDEMGHRDFMLNEARKRGATHLAIIDADEVLTGNLLNHGPEGDRGTWRSEVLHGVPAGHILQLPGYNLRDSLNRYHSNGIWGKRWFSTAFRDDSALSWSGDKFHDREPHPRLRPYKPIQQGQGGVLHLWGVSERRLKAKCAWYKVTERLRWPNKPIRDIEQMYNLWRSPEDSAVMWPEQKEWAKPWEYTEVPASWLEPYAHLMKHLDIDAEPWQEKAIREAVAEHGAETFKGLDLFELA